MMFMECRYILILWREKEYICISSLFTITLPETNIAPENRPSQKERIVFQSTIFRDHMTMLVSGRVKTSFENLSRKFLNSPKSPEPRTKPSYFLLYWLFNRDPYKGL